MPIAHTTAASGTNDAAKQVSVNVWNEAHTISEYFDVPVPTSTPAAPSAGTRVYTSLHAGKAFLTMRDANDVEVMVQPHIGEMAAQYRCQTGVSAGATTSWTTYGCGYTLSASSFSISTPDSTSLLNSLRRSVMTSAGTSASHMSCRPNLLMASQATGFMFLMTVHLGATSTNNLGFFGLIDTAAQINAANDYTTTSSSNKIGLALNANTGNWKLVRNVAATAPTVIDLGASFPINTTDLLRVSLFCERATTTVFYLVENMTSGAVTSGTLTTNLPASGTLMCPHMYYSNNTNATQINFTTTGWSLEQYI